MYATWKCQKILQIEKEILAWRMPSWGIEFVGMKQRADFSNMSSPDEANMRNQMVWYKDGGIQSWHTMHDFGARPVLFSEHYGEASLVMEYRGNGKLIESKHIYNTMASIPYVEGW